MKAKTNSFKKGIATVGATGVYFPGAVIEKTGEVAGGIIKGVAEGMDFVLSLVTYPVREMFKNLVYASQDSKNILVKIGAGVGVFALGATSAVVLAPGLIVYGILKGTGAIVQRATAGIAAPFKEAGEELLFRGNEELYSKVLEARAKVEKLKEEEKRRAVERECEDCVNGDLYEETI